MVGNSIARPWIPISSPFTHTVYIVQFLSYLAGSKSVSARPSNADTMTNTAPEVTTSSSGKIKHSHVEHVSTKLGVSFCEVFEENIATGMCACISCVATGCDVYSASGAAEDALISAMMVARTGRRWGSLVWFY